jgi:hypothetical protein
MDKIKFTNFALSQLATSLSTSDTSILVEAGHGARFPELTGDDFFYVTLESAALVREIVKVTARAGDTLTVVRGQDGTTAAAWAAGSPVALRVNAAALEYALEESRLNAVSSAASAATATTKAGEASTSADNAAASASTATTQASNASTSATTATTKAGEASTSASAAAASATTATTQASNASTSATNAADSASAAAASFDSFDDRYLGPKSTAPTVDNDGNPLLVGALYFDTTLGSMQVRSASGWIAAGSSVNGTADRFRFIATAGQTTFTGADSNGATLGYDSGYIDVYLNGVRLDQADYTATTGTSVVLASGAALSDELNIVAFGTFALADHYTKTAADALLAAKAPLASPSFTGVVSIGAGWTVEQSGTDLLFKYAGTNRMKISSTGDLTVSGNVTAYGTV